MKFEIPNQRFPYEDYKGQDLEIKLDDPQEIEYNRKKLLHARLRFHGASKPIMFFQDLNNPTYDPKKTYRLVPGYRVSEWSKTEKGIFTEVVPVNSSDRDDISKLFLKKGIAKDKNDIIFWSK